MKEKKLCCDPGLVVCNKTIILWIVNLKWLIVLIIKETINGRHARHCCVS